MSIQDELLRSIELMIEKAITKMDLPRDYSSIVEEIDGDMYRVCVNGTYYWVNDGVGCDPQVGAGVYLHSPDSNMTKMYICAVR